MAGNRKKKGGSGSDERLVANVLYDSSRVSGAAGSVGSQYSRNRRSSFSGNNGRASRQNGNARGQSSSNTARGKRGAGAQTPRGGSNRSPGSSTVSSHSNPTNNTRDTQFIHWLLSKWSALEAHQRQSIYSILLLFLSLLLFGSLTIFRHSPLLSGIYHFFMTFFSWSSYLLALGLIAFAIAHLIEATLQRTLVRWPLILGLLAIWLLLLLESRLVLGTMKAGVLAELLVSPLLGWPLAIDHLLVLGLLLIAIVLTFRIRFGHVLMVADAVQGFIAARQSEGPGQARQVGSAQFLGQRPRYSRYGRFHSNGGLAEEADDATLAVPPTPRRRLQDAPPGQRARRPIAVQADEEDEGDIEFEADFDVEEQDPRNDINLYKDEVGRVPRGPRAPLSLDPDEHRAAIKDVQQQPLILPGDEAPPLKKSERKTPAMEPLIPKKEAMRAGARGAKALNALKVANASTVVAPQVDSIWKLPDTSLLHNPEDVKLQMIGEDTATLARTIQETLRSFRVDAEVRPEDISIGPTVIRFGIRPTGKPEMTQDEKGRFVPVRDGNGNIVYETRTRVSRIMALQNDLALVLEAKTIRMEAPVPGRPYVGVEIPNKNSRLVTLREVLESKEYQAAKARSKLAIALGKDVAGQVRVGDLARMPHLLIAGATGAGKSVCINTIIASFLMQATPDDVRLLMVDPKMVELSLYNGIPHLLSPVVTEVEKVVPLLKNAIAEMERRYRLFSQLSVRNLDGYRRLRLEKLAKGDNSLANLPAIVIIIDELADLMMAAPEEVEGLICRLAQLARATGIHLVVATQRPSVDVITGLIKANIPTRISFMVSSAVDSRTIIDMGGAERLLGRGDMLYLPADAGRPERIQGAFLADDEVETLVAYWRKQFAENTAKSQGISVQNADAPTLIEPGWEIKDDANDGFELDDELLDQAEEVVREYGKASISLLQRRLRIGYSRAARLIDLLEEHGIIGPAEQGGRSREVLDNGNDAFGDSHSLADEVADIAAEEKARNEFLRKQNEARKEQS
jgi:DNA segregation ATPase FtsK/SpoIIIE-like protein